MRPERLHPRKRPAAPDPHHSEHDVQIRHRRGHGPAVRSGGRGLFLLPPAKPDLRSRRGQDLRYGGRFRRHADLLWSGGELLRRVQHRQLRRSRRLLLGDLRRHIQSLRRHDEEDGHRLHIRFARLHRRGAGSRLQTQHQGRFRRDDLEPLADRAGYRALCEGRPCARRAADRGQHLRHAGQLPPVRMGRGHCDPLHHQVYGWPRRGSRRLHRRFRQIRLAGARRKVPRPVHARRQLSRHYLC